MNNMTDKLINDGNETRRAKINLVSTSIGGILMILGFFCFVIKAMSVEYIDATGVLHENFFLIPSGYILLFCGIIVIIGTGIKFLIKKRNHR